MRAGRAIDPADEEGKRVEDILGIVKLVVIFALMFAILSFKKPLWLAGLAGAIATVLLFFFPAEGAGAATHAGSILLDTVFSYEMCLLLGVTYMFSFMQSVMLKRGALDRAEYALAQMFNNRRINVLLIPVIMGLLPTPGSILLAAPIIDANIGERYSKIDRAFITSYLRHIPEAWLPTYTTTILAVMISGVAMGSFLIGMLPLTILMLVLIYLFYVRHIDKDTGMEHHSRGFWREFGGLAGALWPILVIMALIVLMPLVGDLLIATGVPLLVDTIGPAVAGIDILLISLVVIVIYTFVCKIPLGEIPGMLRRAFLPKMLCGMAAILVFKGMLAETGAVHALADALQQLPLPSFLVFALIFLLGSIVAGSQTMIVVCMPIVYAVTGEHGAAMLVMLMAMCHAGNQLSPTHVCLSVVSEYYGISLGDLIKKAVPVNLIYCAVAVAYYVVWSQLAAFLF